MDLERQIELCSTSYQKWKKLALNEFDKEKSRKFMEKAFFWLELQTAFITLFTVEQSKGKDKMVKEKILRAKANLSKKLADYASQTLNEIDS